MSLHAHLDMAWAVRIPCRKIISGSVKFSVSTWYVALIICWTDCSMNKKI